MRLFLVLLCLVALAPSKAEAGENTHVGVITAAGSSVTNVTTAVPFRIPPGAYVTLYCTAAMQVLVDNTVVSTSTTGTKGVPIAATTLFPTSVGQAKSSISGSPTAVIAIIGTGSCDVWLRMGNE